MLCLTIPKQPGRSWQAARKSVSSQQAVFDSVSIVSNIPDLKQHGGFLKWDRKIIQNSPELLIVNGKTNGLRYPYFRKNNTWFFLNCLLALPPPIQLTRTISPNLPSQVSAELEDLKRLGRGQPVNPNIYGFL